MAPTLAQSADLSNDLLPSVILRRWLHTSALTIFPPKRRANSFHSPFTGEG